MTGRLEACIRLSQVVGIKGKHVLDVGCSYPWFIDYALKNGAKSASGVEPDGKKVAAARLEVPKAKILQGFADKLDFPDASMDVVTLLDVIEHVPQNTELKVFSEINRVLKKGGHLIISTPNSHIVSKVFDPGWYFGHRHYSLRQLSNMLTSTGFKITQSTTTGGVWEIIGMLNLYISKWILKRPMLFEEWIEEKRRLEFTRHGFTHLMLIAKKY